MPRKKDKPVVSTAKRWEWLRKAEEEGMSPPDIAKEVGYDVRTIRRALDVARQEREMREARLQVYRKATEDHYTDLINFARELQENLNKVTSTTSFICFKSNRLWTALKQHLPRSPLWRSVDKFESLNEEIAGFRAELEMNLEREVPEAVSRLRQNRLIPESVTGAILQRVMILEDEYMPEIKISLNTNKDKQIEYGPFNCGVVPEREISPATSLIRSLMDNTLLRPDAIKLRDLLSQRNKATGVIEEELATIQLKRMVPGRCKYCPV